MTKQTRRKKPISPARAKPRAAPRPAAATAGAAPAAKAKPAKKRGRRRGLLTGLGSHEHERDILDQYLHEVSKTPLLTQKEEIAAAMHGYHQMGISHLMFHCTPYTTTVLERLAEAVQVYRRQGPGN